MDEKNLDITVVIVSYNQTELLKAAYQSIIKFYPKLQVIIVDGSDVDHSCYMYVGSLYGAENNVDVVRARRNVGHGRGMEMGIAKAHTELVLLMDSDAEITHGGVLEGMLSKMDERTFGVGQVITVDENGHNCSPDRSEAIPYLHPYFALINAEIYRRLPGFIHHGAPCIRTMQHLKNFPKYNLVHFPVSTYVSHKGRGTRVLNPPGFHPGTWEKSKI